MVSIGVNTPQMKTSAIRTTVAGGMASGISRKGADRNSPNVQNNSEEDRIPRKNRAGLVTKKKSFSKLFITATIGRAQYAKGQLLKNTAEKKALSIQRP